MTERHDLNHIAELTGMPSAFCRVTPAPSYELIENLDDDGLREVENLFLGFFEHPLQTRPP